jgi:zinc/manganese transport system ATP-binding protein
VRLGKVDVWAGADLTVRAGEVVAVLGPNGAGKSTLLNVILGMLPLAAGSIEVYGAPPTRGNSKIGYLPQRRSFDPDLRVRGRDLVRLGLDGTRFGVPWPGSRAGRAGAQRVDDVLELVGAGPYADRPVGETSGGEQQRLLIAQALVARPSMLLLDEPLDSLDLANQQSVVALVARIAAARRITVLLVAHDVNPILPFIDRVIYLAGGRAVMGKPRDIITTEMLSTLYGAPVEVLTASDGRLVVVGQPDAMSFHVHH